MGKSTAIFVVNQFLKAMSKRKNEFIVFPSDEAAVKKKIEGFSCISRFPMVQLMAPTEICAPNEKRCRLFQS